MLGQRSLTGNLRSEASTKRGSSSSELHRLIGRRGEQLFEIAFCVIICLNCITIGVEAHYEVQTGGVPRGLAEFLSVSEHLFTFIFTVELTLRVRALGFHRFLPTCSANVWNFIDALIVITAIVFTWIIPVLDLLGLHADISSARSLTALRAVRLLRLAHVVRKVEIFHEVWVLVRGISDSLRVLFWTIVVIFFITYFFAVFGLTLLSKQIFEISQSESLSLDQRLQIDELSDYFCGLGSIMFTLVQVLTLDSHGAIMRPIMKYVPWSGLYFYAYIAIAVFVLMNLVTAIIVENAVSNGRNDEEKQLHYREIKKSQELVQLKQLFTLADSDGDGSLSWDEFQLSFSDPDICNKWKLLDFEPEECQKLFRLLDTGDGIIDTCEFFEGLSKMKGSAQSKDIYALKRQVEELKAGMGNIIGTSARSDRQRTTSKESCGSGTPMGSVIPSTFFRGTSPVEAPSNSLREFSISMGEIDSPKNDELPLGYQTAAPSKRNEDSRAEQFNREMPSSSITRVSFGDRAKSILV
ncbi:unnamed protein product [Polarella glacialis]|uniref:EF-hand domain-containing protein n=1 Tax=Polarella glacialis TaxID=89957 RepID=A0A813EKS4_POLGL|nr:unnamed protein product [Polarella glacialis]CAE8709964.1 unnamed protein product [Polarella glacialis]